MEEEKGEEENEEKRTEERAGSRSSLGKGSVSESTPARAMTSGTGWLKMASGASETEYIVPKQERLEANESPGHRLCRRPMKLKGMGATPRSELKDAQPPQEVVAARKIQAARRNKPLQDAVKLKPTYVVEFTFGEDVIVPLLSNEDSPAHPTLQITLSDGSKHEVKLWTEGSVQASAEVAIQQVERLKESNMISEADVEQLLMSIKEIAELKSLFEAVPRFVLDYLLRDAPGGNKDAKSLSNEELGRSQALLQNLRQRIWSVAVAAPEAAAALALLGAWLLQLSLEEKERARSGMPDPEPAAPSALATAESRSEKSEGEVSTTAPSSGSPERGGLEGGKEKETQSERSLEAAAGKDGDEKQKPDQTGLSSQALLTPRSEGGDSDEDTKLESRAKYGKDRDTNNVCRQCESTPCSVM